MKKIITVCISLWMMTSALYAQHKTENIIVVTLDGMRWQEVYKGVDSALIVNKEYTRDSSELVKMFWSDTLELRRQKLFPFFWSTILNHGQLYGDRMIGSNVNLANPYWFSYPGYNEIFTGYPDTAVNSNDKILNKNVNVLEFINKQKGYQGKVAAFSTWDCFPYILNEQRSHVYVNSGFDSFDFPQPVFKTLNDLQRLSPQPIGVRPDAVTYQAAKEYLLNYKPKVLYIAFDETDDYAHGGNYDMYTKAAHAEDAMIKDIWTTVQSMPEYKDKTTLLVACDHGRGDAIKDQWRDHGQEVKDCNHIWIAALGPDTKAMGEVKGVELTQAQLAQTMAHLLGFDFKADHPIAEPITSIYTK